MVMTLFLPHPRQWPVLKDHKSQAFVVAPTEASAMEKRLNLSKFKCALPMSPRQPSLSAPRAVISGDLIDLSEGVSSLLLFFLFFSRMAHAIHFLFAYDFRGACWLISFIFFTFLVFKRITAASKH